jgi:methylmalonyl-CoA/ethylmalonyl-CoA epimerase
MLGKLNHVAIAVVSVEAAAKQYKNILGAKISKTLDLPSHGVKTIFVELDNTKIELLEPIGDNSPIKKFLLKNPSGGMHHICYEVPNIKEASTKLKLEGATILGSGKPTIGAHGKPVIFIHPKDFNGTLIELEEV